MGFFSKFGDNCRNQNDFGLNDKLVGEFRSMQLNDGQPKLGIDDRWGFSYHWSSASNHSDPCNAHFLSNFTITVAGDYWLKVSLSDLHPTHSQHIVQPGSISDNQDFKIVVIPAAAAAANTVAFTMDETGWCTIEKDDAHPRCRTMPGREHKIVVKVRDQFGNERRDNETDTVMWMTAFQNGTLIQNRLVMPWDADSYTVAVQFQPEANQDAGHQFLLKLTVNTKEWEAADVPAISSSDKFQRKPQTPPGKVTISSDTVFSFALWTQLNASLCPEQKNAAVCTTTDCVQSGCSFETGESSFKVTIDWAAAADFSIDSIDGACDGNCKNCDLLTSNDFDLSDTQHPDHYYWQVLVPIPPAIPVPPALIVSYRYDWQDRTVGCGPTRAWNLSNATNPPQIVSPVGRYHHTGGDSHEITVTFSAEHPGFLQFKFSLKSQHSLREGIVVLKPGPVQIRPGALSLKTSTLNDPLCISATRPYGLHDLRQHNIWASGDQFEFTANARDAFGNPMLGEDQLVVEIVRLDKSEITDKRDRDIQPHSPFNATFMTSDLCNATGCTRQSGQSEDISHHEIKLNDRVGQTVLSSVTSLGEYTFKYNFSQFGIYKVTGRLCAANDYRACISSHGEHDLVQSYIFTVCPQNSNITDAEGYGRYIKNQALDKCACKAGFSSSTGRGREGGCKACPAGKFAHDRNSVRCTQCEAGTSCSCASINSQVSDSKTGSNCSQQQWNPACSSCDPCKRGQYQNKPGKPTCHTCDEELLDCTTEKMTWPIAKEGTWMSPSSPQKDLVRCPNSIRCPGSKLLEGKQNSEGIINSATSEEKRCFLDEPKADGGFTVGDREFYPAKCLDILGSRCAVGYAQAKCQKCCHSTDQPPNQPQCDGKQWTDFSTNGICQPCPADSKGLVAFAILVLAVVGAPVVLRFAGISRHLGSLQAPIMSVVNFFQSCDLFSLLHLHWPKQWLDFVHKIASVFNFALPAFLNSLNPGKYPSPPFTAFLELARVSDHPLFAECSFELTYWKKYLLMMFSPFLLLIVSYTFILFRTAASKIAGAIEQALISRATKALLSREAVADQFFDDEEYDEAAEMFRRLRRFPACVNDRALKSRVIGRQAEAELRRDNFLAAAICSEEALVFDDMNLEAAATLSAADEALDSVGDSEATVADRRHSSLVADEPAVESVEAPGSNDCMPSAEPSAELAENSRTSAHALHHSILVKFFGLCDPSKTLEDVWEILDVARGPCAAMHAAHFSILCRNLEEAHGIDPIEFSKVDVTEALTSKRLSRADVSKLLSKTRHSWPRQKLNKLAAFDFAAAQKRVVPMLLWYLMVGYVAITSRAMRPLGCTKNADGKKYMSEASATNIECNWCTGPRDIAVTLWWPFCGEDKNDDKLGCQPGGWYVLGGYDKLATLAYFFSFIYGIGVPCLLFYVMYTNRTEIKRAEYINKFGL